MESTLQVLLTAAVTLGFFHTVLGPDHYVPFIVMAKTKKWSMLKTTWVTTLCGFGHVASSVIIGLIGVFFGLGLSRLELIESHRGNIAGWLFIAFGLAYFVWGIRQAIKNKPHVHAHAHGDGTIHKHEHVHRQEHAHVHQSASGKAITPWVLFIVFIFGPCEVLIPMLMYPAAQHDMASVFMVSTTFGLATMGTMLAIVIISSFGFSFLPMGKLEKYNNAIAGATLLLCGISINFLGL